MEAQYDTIRVVSFTLRPVYPRRKNPIIRGILASTKLHGAITQKTVIFTLVAVGT
jgi:hypothetical protein